MTWIVVVLSLTSPGGAWVVQSWFGPYVTEEYCKVAANNYETAFEGPQSVVVICVKGRRTTEE